jgi:SAM-dependent methyltransferase
MSEKRDYWNRRYADSDLVWGSDPNRFVAEAFRGVAPRGRALDLACGEGRNAIWLAEQGWSVTAVDYSEVALARARDIAAHRGVVVEFIEADVTVWTPPERAFALALVAYLQVPAPDRSRVWKHCVRALGPGGELLLVGHAERNLCEGVGGPSDLAVLWDPAQIAGELETLGVTVTRADHVFRPVADGPRPAIDVLIRAVR